MKHEPIKVWTMEGQPDLHTIFRKKSVKNSASEKMGFGLFAVTEYFSLI